MTRSGLTRRRPVVALAALIVVMVAAACGTTSSNAGAGTAASTKGSQVSSSSSGQKKWSQPPSMQIDQNKTYTATIKTTKGDIVVNLFAKEDPVTVNNFVFLANQGYYNNVPFHRIIKGFMIQTGDPTGTGAGGPGYTFKDEPVTRDYTPGTVAMANAGPNTNGSQFFIVDGDYSGKLPKNYTIFGQVTQGMDVVHAIADTPVGPSAQGEMSKPQQPVSIESVSIKAQ